MISPSTRTVKFLLAAIAIAVLAIFTFVLRVAVHHYQAVMHDFAASPNLTLLKPADTGIANLENVAFRSRDGTQLAAWYVPSHNRAAIVITHGANSDRTSMRDEVSILAELGFGVLAFDWPGAGASGGSVHWAQAERDALVAALDWLTERSDVDANRIGGLGFSKGGYFMAQVASYDSRLRAVILESTIANYLEYTNMLHAQWGALSKWPARLALRRTGMPVNELIPDNVVAAISPRPLLLIIGGKDTAARAEMTHRLYLAAHDPKELWIVPNAPHGSSRGDRRVFSSSGRVLHEEFVGLGSPCMRQSQLTSCLFTSPKG
jgi:dipeptidyl aminopeptidase/acylaminoacyl peptidase